jgi:hypothetical protein
VKFNHPIRGNDKTPQQGKGKVVMRSSHGGWVLNTGGKYGTPGLVDRDNYVSHRKAKKSVKEAEDNIDLGIGKGKRTEDSFKAANGEKTLPKKKKKPSFASMKHQAMLDMGLKCYRDSSGKRQYEAEEPSVKPPEDEKYAPGPTYEEWSVDDELAAQKRGKKMRDDVGKPFDFTHGGNHKAGAYKPDSCPSCATTDKRSDEDKEDLKGLVKEAEKKSDSKDKTSGKGGKASGAGAGGAGGGAGAGSQGGQSHTEVRSPTSTSTDAKTTGNITVTGGAGRGATTTVKIVIPGGLPSDVKKEEVDPLMAAALGYINQQIANAGGHINEAENPICPHCRKPENRKEGWCCEKAKKVAHQQDQESADRADKYNSKRLGY